jgi:uncharacterized protein (TIGR03435 family)
VSITGANVKALIADASGVDMQNVVGGPAWIDSATYDVNATFGDAVAAKLASLSPKERRDQIWIMLRSVMEQRFGLGARRETREMPVYALVLAKGGAKFGPAAPVSSETDPHEVAASWNGHLWTVNRKPMSFWALQLSHLPDVGHSVIDRTGLKGDYKFTFDWPSRADPDVSVFTALEEQLGLKLESTKGPVEVLIIDHIERPSEN